MHLSRNSLEIDAKHRKKKNSLHGVTSTIDQPYVIHIDFSCECVLGWLCAT